MDRHAIFVEPAIDIKTGRQIDVDAEFSGWDKDAVVGGRLNDDLVKIRVEVEQGRRRIWAQIIVRVGRGGYTDRRDRIGRRRRVCESAGTTALIHLLRQIGIRDYPIVTSQSD